MSGTQSPVQGSVFVLVLTYLKPLEEIDALLPAHRQWLDRNYATGTFLASGPRVPRNGGVILARGQERADLVALAATDPFAQAEAAAYDVVEFQPNRGPYAPALLNGA